MTLCCTSCSCIWIRTPAVPTPLRKWQEVSALRQKTASAYIRQFGPIQPRQTDGNAPWGWIEGPWPWEKEAN
ncbi:MAG: spore coat protein CotJB [Ruminococcus sp.]